MNTELEIRRRLEQHQTKYSELLHHLKYINRLLEVSKWLTFGLYLAFAISIYLADIMHLRSFIESATGSMIGFTFYLVVCFMLAYVLAGIKHAAYSHMALFGRVVLIVAVVVSMGLMAEVFQSAGNQDMKARTIAESSAEFKALINDKPAPANNNPGFTQSIAAARQTLARCEQKLKAGKEKHCEGDKAKLESLLESQRSAIETQVAIATNKTELAFKRLDDIKQDGYNPTIRAASEALGVTLSSGIVLIMLFISIQFEILHYWLSEMKARTVAALDGMQGALTRFEVEYYQATGSEYAEGTKPDTPATPPAKQPFGFNQPATAQQQPVFKYQQPQQQPAGFIRTDTLPKQSAPAQKATNAKLGTAETQLNIPEFGRVELSTYNRELAEHGIHSPDDAVLNKADDKAVIQRIIERGLNSGNATAPGTDSLPQKAGAPGTEKRALPVSEAKAGAPGLDTELLAAMQDAMQHVPAEVLKEAGAVYPVWRKQVSEQVIKPSKRDGFRFVSAQLCRGRNRTLTPASMVKLLSIWQLRAVSDGVLRINPNHRSGAAKYLLAR